MPFFEYLSFSACSSCSGSLCFMFGDLDESFLAAPAYFVPYHSVHTLFLADQVEIIDTSQHQRH